MAGPFPSNLGDFANFAQSAQPAGDEWASWFENFSSAPDLADLPNTFDRSNSQTHSSTQQSAALPNQNITLQLDAPTRSVLIMVLSRLDTIERVLRQINEILNKVHYGCAKFSKDFFGFFRQNASSGDEEDGQGTATRSDEE
ncbi:hypothetical protein PG987_003122 [Apiospora arundinis]